MNIRLHYTRQCVCMLSGGFNPSLTEAPAC